MRARDLLAAAAIASACAACTTTTIVEPFYRPEGATVDAAYISPRADFSRYSKLMGQPIEVYVPENVSPPTLDELARLRATFRQAFLDAIGDDYEVVSTPGPDVMLVVAQVIDLKVLGAGGTYVASGRLRDVVARGQLTLLLELRDSVSGTVLARAGESEQGTATALTDETSSWTEVEAAATRWASLFRRFLDNNLK